MEERIEKILSKLSLHEKIALCHANSKFSSEGIPSLGVEELTMNDGPHGVREENHRHVWGSAGRDDDFCTYLPTGTALAATWNPKMGHLHGKVLGEEARFRNKDVILGPGVNIIRTPLCGRNFEYMSEDPCLAAKMVPSVIKGIQGAGTASCVKHFALNNQELDRNFVNVELSERALREIYLPPFQAAAEGGAWTFMGAYNRYLGQHCCHNKKLVCDILKGEWAWDGVFISDWAGVHDTEEAARFGLDIEMGTDRQDYHEYYLADAFEALCREKEEYRALLDDKVRRILRLMIRLGKLDGNRPSGSFNTKEHQRACYTIAAESMVLLKNEGVLPLSSSVKRILVVGENAEIRHAHGGNSSGIKALYEVSLLDGLKNRFGESCIDYIKSTHCHYTPIPIEYLDIADLKAGCRGFRMECFDNGTFEGNSRVHFVDQVKEEHGGASRIFTATLNVPETGEYRFYVNADRRSELFFDSQSIHRFRASNNGIPFEFTRYFEKGQRVEIRLEAVTVGATPLELLWSRGGEEMSEEELVARASAASAVIFCGGLNHSFDTESFDRPDMALHGDQNELIPLLARANPNTIVALTAGSPVEMPWLESVPAVVWTWYAGMEAGNVFADLVSGRICPSGKLPFSIPAALSDSPAHRYGEYKKENCKYNEDIFVGYRGLERDRIRPLFAFGHGLSYADIKLCNVSVTDCSDELSVSLRVENRSDFPAKQTVQVYVGSPAPDRPVKELKAFSKIEVPAGESVSVCLTVPKKELRIWDGNWRFVHGSYSVFVGTASDAIEFETKINL